MHHQQQQTPTRHQFHPYFPLPLHHRLQQQHQHNATTNQQRHTVSSKIVKSSVTSAVAAPLLATQKPKRIPLGASPSYHIASTAINQFYQFRETPNLIAQTNHSTVHKVFSHMYVCIFISGKFSFRCFTRFFCLSNDSSVKVLINKKTASNCSCI